MNNLTRRKFLAVGAASVLAGCGSASAKPEYTARIVGVESDHGVVRSVSLAKVEDSPLSFVDSFEFKVLLVEDHGYGEVKVEECSSMTRCRDGVRTFKPTDDSVTFEFEGSERFVGVIADTDDHETAELIVEFSTVETESDQSGGQR